MINIKTLKITLAFLLAVSVVVSTGCAKSPPSCRLLLSAVENCFENSLPVCMTVYNADAASYTRSHLTPELASLLYYGEKRDSLYELSLLSDYTIRLADGQSGAEIHILKVTAKSDLDTVESMVRRRLDYMKSRSIYIYTPENYEKYMSCAAVYKIESYIILLATPDNQKAFEAIKAQL